ncbi:AP-4-A phosphorylase [Pirellulimonas nuda]|uniref:AP-4-A phosphorylase n=1 Tax=Pirellulimonas nuda TaxID=2528009 RepID=A0A518DGN3_9BACT|nr:HIT domain-containing protein [Pirellulimonas nuda]QDU90640.1 AP-4-A phosphorylase [Pirellulimonas nuda]
MDNAPLDERIWAPWRLGYVKGDAPGAPPPEPSGWRPAADHGCFLCRAAAEFQDLGSADQQLLVIRRRAASLVLLNRFPYANGHLLVAPLRHVGGIAELTDAEHLEMQQSIAYMTDQLRERLTAQGFNVGLNLGRDAGAGVPGHLHWHIVPRWPGDHNFMPTLAGVRVIPQSLEAVWELLRGDE